ncbi:hypothetical protein J6590_054777 [Homalodisca vitripennis]|nr:hypothetical protein J6590_054777 [Homalodisca vitripennis]
MEALRLKRCVDEQAQLKLKPGGIKLFGSEKKEHFKTEMFTKTSHVTRRTCAVNYITEHLYSSPVPDPTAPFETRTAGEALAVKIES